MRYQLLAAICITSLLTGCEFSVSTNKTPTKATEVSSKEGNDATKGAIIKNDIELDVSNVKVKKAFLADDNGNVLDENEVKLGEKVNCVILLDTGWTKYNDKSFVGASEKIMTNGGAVILDAPDIFSQYETSGLAADDAGAISLSAKITTKEPGVDDYKVQFRIWDKKGNGEVTGRYKFKVH